MEKSAGYEGTCHCGRLAWRVGSLPERVTHCNCSICRRYNAVWGYYTRQQVTLVDTDGSAVGYRWNDEVIDFVHCRVCGCMTHYEDVDKTPGDRVAVNFRMCPDTAWEQLPVRHFDGADTFAEIGDG